MLRSLRGNQSAAGSVGPAHTEWAVSVLSPCPRSDHGVYNNYTRCAVFVFFKNGIHLSCLLRPVSVWDLRVADIALHHCHSPGATVTQRNFICDWFLGKVTIARGTRYLPLPWPFQEGNKKTENCFCAAFMCCMFRQTRSNYACVAPIQNVRRLQLFVRWIMNFYA